MSSRDHYLPAGFVGGFGDLRPGKSRREAKVIARTKSPDAVSGPQAAQTFCYDKGLYQVAQPTAALPADYAEVWWKTYEKDLPDAVLALEAGTAGAAEWQTVLRHIQAAWARHLDFDRDAAEQKKQQGVVNLTGDCLEYVRKTALDETAKVLAAARFALLRRDRHAEHLVCNDKGFTTFGGADEGVFFPLNREIAVLMAVGKAAPGEVHDQAPYAERTINARGVTFLNNAAWDQIGIRLVFAHPDDEALLKGLTSQGTGSIVRRALRPFRHTREPGLFDWS
jgi:hypothetical protein